MSGLYSMPSARSAALGRGDHGAAVTRSEIHHEVLRRDLGHVEHLVDERLRRRHPDDVLASLADLGLEWFCLRGLRECICGEERQGCRTERHTEQRSQMHNWPSRGTHVNR